jgi:hypothetical protein
VKISGISRKRFRRRRTDERTDDGAGEPLFTAKMRQAKALIFIADFRRSAKRLAPL